MPTSLALRYLQLPQLDPRIPELAGQVTASAATVYDKAAAIQQYLMTRYGYTLQLPRSLPRDPVANFLFVRRQGHCEYFASAMAIMLRTQGTPARIVNGFRGGEFNDLTGSYLIRGRDAHSWVEAYIPGFGWTTFDPTPAGPGVVPARWNRLQLYLDAAAEFWREWVVNYDATQQRSLEETAGQGTRAWWQQQRAWLRTQYAALLARAAVVGLPRREAETPFEFLPRLTAEFPNALSDLRALTEAYVAVHYAQQQATPGQVHEMRVVWQRLRKELVKRT